MRVRVNPWAASSIPSAVLRQSSKYCDGPTTSRLSPWRKSISDAAITFSKDRPWRTAHADVPGHPVR